MIDTNLKTTTDNSKKSAELERKAHRFCESRIRDHQHRTWTSFNNTNIESSHLKEFTSIIEATYREAFILGLQHGKQIGLADALDILDKQDNEVTENVEA